jgi:ABC-type transporter Mla MlaB component
MSLPVITLSAQYFSTHVTARLYSVSSVSQHKRQCLSLICQLSISAQTSLPVITLSAQYLSTNVTACHYSVSSVSQHTRHCLSLLCQLSISVQTSLSLVTLSAHYLSTHFTACRYSASMWSGVSKWTKTGKGHYMARKICIICFQNLGGAAYHANKYSNFPLHIINVTGRCKAKHT